MSGYASQPRQFANYTPEVNADLYEKLLTQKEQKYEEGIQRVEANRDAVASLPIYNSAGREYLNQKLAQQTTELNQQQGVDWSDQGIQRLTNKHISAITEDPEIQKSVYYSTAYKKDYLHDKQQYDETDGASIANHDAFTEDASKWLTGPLGTQYGAKSVPYMDINKKADEFLSKLKPDLLQLVHTADAKNPMAGWEKAIRKIEGINKQKLQDSLDEFINTTPGVRDQMNVNGRYEYKNYTDSDYLNRLEKVNNNIQASYHKSIMDMERQKLYTTDPDKLAEINAYIKNIQTKQLPALENYDYSKDMELFQNPQFKPQLKNNLYERNWKYGILTSNSGGDKYEEDYGGMSPRETYFQGKAKELADKKYLHDISQDDIKNSQWERHFKWEQDKEDKTTNPQGIPISPVRTDAITDDFVAAEKKAELSRESVGDSKIDILASMLASKGVVDDIGTSKYFDQNLATGKTVIKEGYIPLTDKAATFLAHPSPDMSGLVYGQDFVSNKDYLVGFTDKQGRYHNGVVDNLMNGQSAGNYGLPKERAINLSMSDRQALANLKTQQKNADVDAGIVVAGKRKLQQFLDSDPESKRMAAELDTYFQPFKINVFGKDMAFSRDQLNEFFRYYKQAVKDIDGQDIPQEGLDKPLLLQRSLQGKFGFNKDAEIRTLLDHFKGIDQIHMDFENKKSKYLGDWAKNLGVSPIINGYKLTNGEEKIVKDVSGTVQAVVNYLDPEAKSYDNLRGALKKGLDGDNTVSVALGYDELKPDAPYFYEVNSSKGKSERVHFTEQNALTLGIPINRVKPTESQISRTLKKNGALYGTGFQSTVNPGKSNSWENADNIVMTKDNELRYVIEHSKTGPYVLYKYWMKNGKLEPREEMQYNNLDDAEKKLNELRNIVH